MFELFFLSKSATSIALDISEGALLVFGALLVVGLIGESAKSDRWKKRLRLFELFVIIGVAGELLADGGIFGFSKHLQAITETEIADLNVKASGNEKEVAKANERAALANERTASLEVEAIKLRKQLVLQGARENLLSGDNRRQLVDTLKKFARQKVDVRYSAQAMMVNGTVVTSTPLGDDTVGLANALVGVMNDAGWRLPPTALLYNVQGYGINVEIVQTASPSTRAAAEALAKALRDVSLVVFGPQVVSADRAQRVGKEAQALSPPLGENTIVLGVLTHPK